MTDKKLAIVTGGLSGIGLAIVTALHHTGYRLLILDIDVDTRKHVVESLGADGAVAEDIECIECDIADQTSVMATFDNIRTRYGNTLDVLVNNAGISERASVLETRLEDWNRIIGVNLTGVFLVSQQAIPLFAANASGIINIASVSGMVGMPHYLSYNVSKAGVIELTKSLAIELAPDIRVNAICPGYILTDMQKKEYSSEALKECEATVPLQRLGQPEEIASLVEYLTDARSRFMTGSILVMDGGETAGGTAS